MKTKKLIWVLFLVIVFTKQFLKTLKLQNKKQETSLTCFGVFVLQIYGKHGEQPLKTVFINGSFVIF